MGTVALMPPANGATTVVNGRKYSAVAGAVTSAPDFDAFLLEANGWLPVTGSSSHATGTTASRPSNPKTGDRYADATLGFIVIWEGKAWRNPLTGASV